MKYKEDEHLSLLLNNQISNEPTELLSQSFLQSLFNDLKNDYDYILVDTPPIHLKKVLAFLIYKYCLLQ